MSFFMYSLVIYTLVGSIRLVKEKNILYYVEE
jgi:hypothetical protein